VCVYIYILSKQQFFLFTSHKFIYDSIFGQSFDIYTPSKALTQAMNKLNNKAYKLTDKLRMPIWISNLRSLIHKILFLSLNSINEYKKAFKANEKTCVLHDKILTLNLHAKLTSCTKDQKACEN
jgi:hypothetical protein